MKLELQAGDTITVPKGCKAVIKDGRVIFKKEHGFKDGDVLCHVDGDLLLIFKGAYVQDKELFNSYYNTGPLDNKGWYVDVFRHATEEEKQLLFNKMKKQGLQWNSEEKRVEKIRWRAKFNNKYYRINEFFESEIAIDDYNCRNDYDYDVYNYFRTEEYTKETIRRIKETLRKYHEEIKE